MCPNLEILSRDQPSKNLLSGSKIPIPKTSIAFASRAEGNPPRATTSGDETLAPKTSGFAFLAVKRVLPYVTQDLKLAASLLIEQPDAEIYAAK